MNETAKPKPLSVLIAEHEAAAFDAERCDRLAAGAREAEQAAAKAVLAAAGEGDPEYQRKPLQLVTHRGRLCRVLNWSGHRRDRSYCYELEPVAFAD